MKGKERSPVKAKRSRGAEESSRERCGKKLTSTNDSGSVTKSSESGGSSGRRGLHLDKGLSSNRDYEASSRAPGLHSYGSPVASSGSGSSKGADNRGGAVPRSSEGRGGEAEYKSLRISELGSSLSDEAVEDGLFHEFKKFGDVSVKISRSGDERVALVNFRRPEDARAAKHARGRLVLYDRPLKIEAVYTTGSSRRRSRSPGDKEPYSSLSAAVSSLPSHRHPHGQRGLSPAGLGYRDYRLQQLALGRLPPPPPPPLPRDLDRDRDYNFYESRIRPAYPLDQRLNIRDDDSSDNDIRANRTLFLGNLDINVTESELRRAFERFGTITEVDIKRATRGQSSTYGFIKFENLDMAQRAKLAMSGKPILRNCIKIGYGKATPTNRLWVGGLGHWVPMASLAREFDRFGTIRSIDYRKGDSWAYIQYESLDAAQAACSQMRGFPLGGEHRRLRVDFADTDHVYQPPYLQPLPLPHYDLVGDAFAHRAPESLRARDRTSPLLYRERERDLYGDSDWVPLPIRDRNRVPYDSLETLDRRVDGWSSLDRERERDGVNKEQPRKRRLIDEARHVDRSPESDRSRKRHCASPDRSPDGSGGRDSRYSDTDRAHRTEQSSPSRDWRGSLERGLESKRDRKNSNSVERDRKHRIIENKSPLKKDERLLESSSKVKSPQKQDANQNLCMAWQGMLLLKNSNFPSNMHLLQGDLAVATGLLIEGTTGGKVAQLKITQRLRLDQPKLDEVTRRIKVAGPNGYAVLLAVPGTTESNFTGDQASSTQRPLRNLVSYLKQKQAAGVISLPVGSTKDKENTGVLHAFPPCEFSQQFLDSSAKALAKSEDDYLVMIIVRGAS